MASIAGFNARRCRFAHDKCRNTKDYPYSGQNIAIISSSDDFLDDKDAINQLFQMWAGEYVNCTMDVINSYHPVSGPEIGHFTQIINNKSNDVGCSMTKYHCSEGATSYLVCNYGLTNMRTQKIYTCGAPASACTAGVSTRYPSLCLPAESETLKPFPYGYEVTSTSSSSSYTTESEETSSYSVDGGPAQTVTSYSAPQTVTTEEETGPEIVRYQPAPSQIFTHHHHKPQVTTVESSSPDGIQTITTSSSTDGADAASLFAGFPSFGSNFAIPCGGRGGTTVVHKKLGNGGEITITRTESQSNSAGAEADNDDDDEQQSFFGGLLFR